MTLTDFLERYEDGIDYDGCYGKQCVDYVNQYAKEVLGIKDAFYGQGIQYAYQVYSNYDNLSRVKAAFTRIANEKTNFPLKGDVVVWAKERNGYAGHIAVVLAATEHTLTVAEQNFDGKGGVRRYTYQNYNHVLGWLRAKNAKVNKPSVKAGQLICLKRGAQLYNYDFAQSGVKRIGDFSVFESDAPAVFKIGTKLQVKELKQKANGNIWVKTKYADGWICIYDYKGDISKV